MATSKTIVASKEAASITQNGETPQTKDKKQLKLPCTIDVFFTYCTVAWGYAKQYSSRLMARRPLYTEGFISEQEALVKVVEALPTLRARLNAVTNANIQLSADNQAVRSLLQLLKNYIQFAFKDKAQMEAQLRAAGLTDYSSKLNNWQNTSGMVRDARQYLASNTTRLSEGENMPKTFPADFTEAANKFEASWLDFIAKEKASTDGTATQDDRLEDLLTALNPMLDIAQRVFEFEPVERKKFTRTHLLNEVRSRHFAAIQGTVKFSTTDKPMAGVRVEIAGVEDAFALTDNKGRFSINIPGGESYNVQFSSPGTEPLTLSKFVKPGVKGELKATLSPMTAVETAPPTSPNITEMPNISNTLSVAMGEVKPKEAQSNGQEVAVH